MFFVVLIPAKLNADQCLARRDLLRNCYYSAINNHLVCLFFDEFKATCAILHFLERAGR